MIETIQHWLEGQGEWGGEMLVALDVLLEKTGKNGSDGNAACRELFMRACDVHDIWVVYRTPRTAWRPSRIIAHRVKELLGELGGLIVLIVKSRCGKEIIGGQLARVPCEPGRRPGIEFPLERAALLELRRHLNTGSGKKTTTCRACRELPRWNPKRARAKSVAVGEGVLAGANMQIPAGTAVALGPDGRLVPAASGAPAIGTVAPVEDPRCLDDGRVVTMTIERDPTGEP